MDELADRVAVISGAARGQGRSHAVALARRGAHLVLVDSCEGSATAPWMKYALASEQDLLTTVHEVEAAGGRAVAAKVDVRDIDALRGAIDRGVDEFGRIDIVVANAGICGYGPEAWNVDDGQWQHVYEVNLLGARNLCKVAVPAILAGGRGGSVVFTSSGLGLRGSPSMSDYCATKWGVIGFAMSLAKELGPRSVRVNVLAPGTVDTDMIQHKGLWRLFRPDLEDPTLDDVIPVLEQHNTLRVPWVEPEDVSNALLFLVSDAARYITGAVLPIGGTN